MGAQTNHAYGNGPLQGLSLRGRPSDARLRAQRTRTALFDDVSRAVIIGIDEADGVDTAVMAAREPGGGWRVLHFGAYCPDAEAADHDALMQSRTFEDRAPSPIAWQTRREPRGTGARIMILTAIACAVLLVCWWLS